MAVKHKYGVGAAALAELPDNVVVHLSQHVDSSGPVILLRAACTLSRLQHRQRFTRRGSLAVHFATA